MLKSAKLKTHPAKVWRTSFQHANLKIKKQYLLIQWTAHSVTMPAIFFGGAGGECISLKRISILKENSFRRKKKSLRCWTYLWHFMFSLLRKPFPQMLQWWRAEAWHLWEFNIWLCCQQQKIILPRECEGSKVLKTNGRTSDNRRTQPSVEPKNIDFSEMLCFRQSLLLLSFTF